MSDGLKGDIICMGVDGVGCGAIVQDHTVHQGAEKRNFEGEEVIITTAIADGCIMKL